jgi:hypothetical protein
MPPVPFCFSYFWQGFAFLPWTGFRPWSSYLWTAINWDHKWTSPSSAAFAFCHQPGDGSPNQVHLPHSLWGLQQDGFGSIWSHREQDYQVSSLAGRHRGSCYPLHLNFRALISLNWRPAAPERGTEIELVDLRIECLHLCGPRDSLHPEFLRADICLGTF